MSKITDILYTIHDSGVYETEGLDQDSVQEAEKALIEYFDSIIGEDEPEMVPPNAFESTMTNRPLLLDVPAKRRNDLRAELKKRIRSEG